MKINDEINLAINFKHWCILLLDFHIINTWCLYIHDIDELEKV